MMARHRPPAGTSDPPARIRGQDLVKALAVGTCVLYSLSPGRALAQSSSNEVRADALFNAAKQLRDGGQVADACPLFAESKRLAPAVGVTLYLADCYQRLGRTASAWEQFQDAERLARDKGDKRAATAHDRAHALEAKLNRLTVAAPPGPHEGWQVLVDGAPLPADRWNAALAVDPGDHVIAVQVPGQSARTLTAHVDASNPSATVHIDDGAGASTAATAAAAPAPTSPAAATPAPAAPESGSSETPSAVPVEHSNTSPVHLWAGLGLVGTGAVGLAFGTFFLVRRDDLSSGSCSNSASLADQAQTAATIAFAAGGVALVTGIAVLLSAPAPKSQVGWMVAPVPVSGGAGATLRASF
jgi:hypothetical protein